MVRVAERFASILRSEGFPKVFAYYSEGIDANLIRVEVEREKKRVVFISASNVVDDSLSMTTYGCILTANILVNCFAQTDSEAIQGGLDIIGLGHTATIRNGRLTAKVFAPFMIGGIPFYQYDPVGSVDEVAEKLGNIYFHEQLLRVQFAIGD